MTLAMIWGLIGDYTIAAALGAVVSSGEIVARYRDEPWDTLRSLPAIFYMLINALASMAALTVVRTFNINFGANETNPPDPGDRCRCRRDDGLPLSLFHHAGG